MKWKIIIRHVETKVVYKDFVGVKFPFIYGSPIISSIGVYRDTVFINVIEEPKSIERNYGTHIIVQGGEDASD